jgi:hypothetical protein
VTADNDITPLIPILVGAVIAAVGYVSKLIIEAWREWRNENDQRQAQLHQLGALLEASRAIFLVQRDQAKRLADRLGSRFPDERPDEPGFEELFGHLSGRFDRDEEDLHGIIRAYTEHGLKPLNEAMLSWLEADTVHRTARGKKGNRAVLAKKLNELDAHLRLWLAKYQAWLPNHPEHALVYLADEEKHGLGFPTGIEDVLDSVAS